MGEIQKSAAKCALSWALLTALLCGLYYYANHVVTVELEAPQIQAQTLEDGAVSLTWNAVDYATSYRIYQRPVNGDWSLVKAVPSITLSYTVEEEFDGPAEYSVRTVVFAEEPVARKAAKSCSPVTSAHAACMEAKSGFCGRRTAKRSESGNSLSAK